MLPPECPACGGQRIHPDACTMRGIGGLVYAHDSQEDCWDWVWGEDYAESDQVIFIEAYGWYCADCGEQRIWKPNHFVRVQVHQLEEISKTSHKHFLSLGRDML